jgi:guanylate kinase
VVSPGQPAAPFGAGPSLLVVLSGPSGVGKDAVIERMKERGLPFHYAVTATTRPRRPSERDGMDYYFLSEEGYDRLLAEGGFLEHARVYQHRYGVPRAPLQKALAEGRDVIVRTDVQGARTIRRLVPEAVLVFLAPSSGEELERRLSSRRTDSAEARRLRLETARQEMARAAEFDYVVTNETDRLDQTVDRLLAIVAEEKAREGRQPVRL